VDRRGPEGTRVKYFVKVGDRELEVLLEERDGEVFARVGNRETKVSYAEVDGLGQYSILTENRSWAASIESNKNNTNEFSVGLAGEVYTVSIENERERAAHAAAAHGPAGPRTLNAAMPGIVISVLAKEGDSVEAGAALLILEAMKMQNEVRAEAAGVVKRIFVEAGKTVSAGQPLVSLDSAK
jgi:biotin carboxyl carrier protein